MAEMRVDTRAICARRDIAAHRLPSPAGGALRHAAPARDVCCSRVLYGDAAKSRRYARNDDSAAVIQRYYVHIYTASATPEGGRRAKAAIRAQQAYAPVIESATCYSRRRHRAAIRHDDT